MIAKTKEEKDALRIAKLSWRDSMRAFYGKGWTKKGSKEINIVVKIK